MGLKGYSAAMLGLAAAMLSVPKPAQALPSVAIGGEVSTLGVGAQVTFEVIPWINLRTSAQGFRLSDDFDKDNIHYEGHARLFTYGELIDIYPLVWGPRISLGVMGNSNRVDGRARCQDQNGCNVQGVQIFNSQDARINGTVKFNHVAPYAGLGWGNMMLGFPFYVSFDAGVLYQGRPKVHLTASGTATVIYVQGGVARPNDDLATDPQVQQAIRQEQDVLADDLKNYRFYPVASLTLGWRF